MKKNRCKANYTGWLFLFPGLIGVCVFYLIPFLDVVRRSFTQGVGGTFAGLDNYRIVLENKAFHLAAYNTIKFVLVCLPLLLVLSLGVALLLQGSKLSKVFKSAYLIPLAVPAASVVLLWQLLFHQQGMLNGLLSNLHLPVLDWMNTNAAFPVLVFSYIWKNLGYDVVLWSAGLSSVPESIYEAAKVDGANGWHCFTKITLPCIRPVSFTIIVISFLNSFKVFREAYLVAGNYPQDSIYLLQHLFNNWFRELSVDKMAAGAVMLAIVILIPIYLLQKTWRMEDEV